MAQEPDDLFKELEQSIIDDMRRTHSEQTVDHFLNPRNLGRIPTPDGMGRITDPRGNTMEICLKVKDDRVVNASFWTDGCGCSIASGSIITQLAKGRRIVEAQRITQQDVVDGLGGLPKDDRHCAALAANTLKEAIKDYLTFKRDQWKRAYKGDPDLK